MQEHGTSFPYGTTHHDLILGSLVCRCRDESRARLKQQLLSRTRFDALQFFFPRTERALHVGIWYSHSQVAHTLLLFYGLICRTKLLHFLSLGYIGEFEVVDDHRANKIVIELTGRLNKCGVISPRFDVTLDEIEKWVVNLLPSRQFGHILLSTTYGIMTHEEARRKKTGGKILGFFY